MFRLAAIAMGILYSFSALAADLVALERLFKSNFDSFYQPRFCGQNISRLAQTASDQKIDLSQAYVLKIEGAGFWETSAFSSREAPGERVNLGRFHVVLVADNHVFDFDLSEPIVLPLGEYILKQFHPPTEPYFIFGNRYEARRELPYWETTAFEITDYFKGTETVLWKRHLDAIPTRAQSSLACGGRLN